MWKQSYYLVLCVAIFSFLSLISCGGGGGGSEQQSPHILVSTENIDFGDIILDGIAEQAFTIQNVGSSTLSIGPIAYTDLAPPFSILNDVCSGKTLTASQKCTFTVQFSPISQGRFSGSFDIPSNDPKFPSVTVGVIGNAEGLRVSINQITTDNCTNIELQMSVFDKDNNAVSGLSLDNVTLTNTENNEPINFYLTNIGTILPDSVAMVLDFSGSLIDYYGDVKASSKQFVDDLNLDDWAAIIKFGADIELEQPFTDNTNDLNNAIDGDYTGGIGATVLYDALWYAIDLTKTQQNNRVIVVISDGWDENPKKPGLQGSVKTLTEVINHAKETGVSIFTIGLGTALNVDVLGQLASETGGQFFPSPTSDQLTSIYQAIRDILNGQYRIIYPPAASDPITVKVNVDTGIYQGDAIKQVQGCL